MPVACGPTSALDVLVLLGLVLSLITTAPGPVVALDPRPLATALLVRRDAPDPGSIGENQDALGCAEREPMRRIQRAHLREHEVQALLRRSGLASLAMLAKVGKDTLEDVPLSKRGRLAGTLRADRELSRCLRIGVE